MTIKEFLKPDKRKGLMFFAIIVLFVLSAIISWFIGLGVVDYYEQCYPDCDPHYKPFYYYFLLVSYSAVVFLLLPMVILTRYTYTPLQYSLFYLVPISLIFWYFLSCVIIFIYDRIKGRKKKQKNKKQK